jgi:hypothetical protein
MTVEEADSKGGAGYLRDNTDRWYIHRCSPIDWWCGWTEISVTWQAEGAQVEIPDHFFGYLDSPEEWPADIAKPIEVIDKAFKQAGWQGDGGWRIAPLPDPETFSNQFLYSVKQSRAGMTFIASPFSLPWLGEWLVAIVNG